MKYSLKQYLLDNMEEYVIRDESGNDIYIVDANYWPIGHKISIQDLDRNELLLISEKITTFKTNLEIYKDNSLYAYLSKPTIQLLNNSYTIEMTDFENYLAEGNFEEYEYIIYTSDKETILAIISKQYFDSEDTYGLETDFTDDAILFIAVALIIDIFNNT